MLKILFLNVEKAAIHTMCEFGYVVTNENYNILDKGNIIINPYTEYWDDRLLSILTRSKEEYEKADPFDLHVDKMKELIDSSDYIITRRMEEDIMTFQSECKRYDCGQSEFDFYSLKRIHSDLYDNNTLGDLANELGIKEDRKHDAGEEALITLSMFKLILEKSKKNIAELFYSCPECKLHNNGFCISIPKDPINPLFENEDELKSYSISWSNKMNPDIVEQIMKEIDENTLDLEKYKDCTIEINGEIVFPVDMRSKEVTFMEDGKIVMLNHNNK